MFRKIAIALISLALTVPHANAQMKPGWVFHDELIAGLESTGDTIYIQDRKKLEKLTGLRAYDDSSVVNCKTRTGDRIHIAIERTDYVATNHASHELMTKNIIDRNNAYGVDETNPKKELKNPRIKWNQHWIAIPKDAYSNLYNPGINIEAYLSKNRKLLYVYMQGGDGARSYSVKFVFDKTHYLTRLITTNECVDEFDFLDATSGDCK